MNSCLFIERAGKTPLFYFADVRSQRAVAGSSAD